MIVAHDVADDFGGLGVLLVELQAHVLHAVEDAAMDGLEAVTDVGQSAADDDGHRVVEIAAAHLLLDVDGEHGESTGTGGRCRAVAASAAGKGAVGVGVLGVWGEGEFGVLIVCHSGSILAAWRG